MIFSFLKNNVFSLVLSDTFSQFIRKCNLLSNRPLNRLVFEAIFFFVAPAGTIALFYIRLGVNLIRRSRNQSRNRVLTLAFVLSWLMWIVCWSPNFAIMMVQYYDIQDYIDISRHDLRLEYYYYPFWSYIVSFRIPFQLLYSHLNPFIYLIVLKKFQKHHIATLKWIFRTFLQTQVVQNSNSVNDYLRKASVFLKASFSTFSFVLPWAVLLTTFHHATEYSSLLNSETSRASNIVRKVVDSSMKRISVDNQVFRDWDSNLNIRSECGQLGGLYNLKFKRCYFIIDHQAQLLNSSELIKSCRNNGAKLCYPRNKNEISLIWKVFELWVGRNLNLVPNYDYVLGFAAFYYEYYDLATYRQHFLQLYKAHIGFERLGKE